MYDPENQSLILVSVVQYEHFGKTRDRVRPMRTRKARPSTVFEHEELADTVDLCVGGREGRWMKLLARESSRIQRRFGWRTRRG